MKTSSPGNVPSTGLNLRLSTEAMPDADAQTPHSFTAERQARRQAEQAHEEKLRQRGARIQAANEAVAAYMRESGTRDYQQAFGYIQRTRPELFAQMQVPAGLPVVENPRRARMLAVNDAVSDYMRESGTRDYSAAFNHIVRTRSDLFAGMQDSSGLLAAANFNPYHDQTGRFTTSDGAEGGRDDGLDGQGGGQTKPASIAQYAYPREGNQNYNRCPLYSLQTIIASKTGKEAPGEAEIQARFAAEATRLGLKTIDWNKGTDLRDGDYTKIVQNVLKSYGIDSSAALRYNSPQDLANAIIAAKGEPAMLNISLAGHEGAEDHSVTVQWEPSGTDQNKGMFRVNNIAGMGGSKLFSQKDFTSGKIFSDINPSGSARSATIKSFSVDKEYAVVIAKSR